MSTKAWRLMFRPGTKVDLEEFELPDPGPHQILVRVTRSQVSAGSEMQGVQLLNRTGQGSRTNGYTTAGWVEKVGPGVEAFRPGDRVLAFGNHASHWLVDLGEPPADLDGLSYPDRVPEGLSDEWACFAVLGDVALHGVRRASLQIDESVAVFGVGVVGQLTVQFARLSGAYPIVAVDLVANRLNQAKTSGATHFVDASAVSSPQAIREMTGGGAQAVFHCSANPKILQTCMEAAGDRGKVILTGSAPGTAEIGLQVELLRHELSIIGIYETRLAQPHPYWPWTRSRNRRVCFRLMMEGQVKVDYLISHVVPPTRAQEMYRMIAAGGSDWMSVFFNWE